MPTPAYAFEGRVLGGPSWVREQQFDIEAKKDPKTSPEQLVRETVGSGMNLPTNQIAEFLQYLSFVRIDRPGIDRTGLTGYLDFQLHYDYAPFGAMFARSARTEGLSFFTALQEQLGLKLEPAREVTDVVVIDSVEMPIPD